MICITCYHLGNCDRKPENNGRCDLYLKNGSVILGRENLIDVRPPDTDEFGLLDVKRIFSGL